MNETIDLQLLGSRPAEDWRHELSMAIQSFADSAHKIADALNSGGEKAAYIRANARQFGEPLPLQLVCSVWMVMENLGTTTGSQAAPSISTRASEQGAEETVVTLDKGCSWPTCRLDPFKYDFCRHECVFPEAAE